jgi:hypothetical protein
MRRVSYKSGMNQKLIPLLFVCVCRVVDFDRQTSQMIGQKGTTKTNKSDLFSEIRGAIIQETTRVERWQASSWMNAHRRTLSFHRAKPKYFVRAQWLR